MDYYHPPTSQGTIEALSAIYRALRAWKFYPLGHPNLRIAINNAHSAMLSLLSGHNLSLSCGRTGFSFPDGEILVDSTRLATSLSYELFARRVQKITFLQDLYYEDLTTLLKILALSPDTVHKSGGVDSIMAEHGIRSIWVNEFDLSVIHGKRLEIESRGIFPQVIHEDEGAVNSTFTLERFPLESDDIPPELLLPTLLQRLEATQNDDFYMILVRQATSCCDSLKLRHEFLELFPLIELLAGHAEDTARNENIREFARFAIEHISTGNDFIRFVLSRMELTDGLSKSALQSVLANGGPAAVVLTVEHLGLTGKLSVRKILSNLLAKLGEEAVPALTKMLLDRRWYIVRNISVVLGAIASLKAVPGLVKCLQHTDVRVCKEAIRSLAKIGGSEAEDAIIGILHKDNYSLYPQAITSLGGMKSRKSLVELMDIVKSKDMFLKSLELKIDAVAAIALIGDNQVAPDLLEMFTTHHLLATRRWKHLKTAIARCLGKLGDPRTLPVLKELAVTDGELGAACREAVEMIDKAGGGSNGGP